MAGRGCSEWHRKHDQNAICLRKCKSNDSDRTPKAMIDFNSEESEILCTCEAVDANHLRTSIALVG